MTDVLPATGQIPMLARSTSPRQAYRDLRLVLEGQRTPCSEDEAWTVGLSPEDWTDETPKNRDARKRCNEACPREVRLACALYAMAAEEPHGIWGGMTPRERSFAVFNR